MPRPVALITGPTSGIGAGRRGFVRTEFHAGAGMDMAKLPRGLMRTATKRVGGRDRS
ncbi:hypothetical protein [Mycobacterium sp.]|uniref:hypothetical protein n=1 Tax=Mycobacterium sp. TaxID=1785 RepID=UPI002638A336|nr:hypothetical protein [Mycobacterium sp.]